MGPSTRAGEGAPDPLAWLAAAERGRASLRALREAAAGCRACPLWQRGTQAVFGAGPKSARVLLVGEQPGDREDVLGRPFVGPAGRLLDEGLRAAGFERRKVYVTNAVKHFKWRPSGKRRLHEKPSPNEVRACRPWLQAELAAVAPDLVVCLGATAARSLLGASFRVTQERGRPVASPLARHVVATVHPSSVLRAPSSEERRRETERFFEDLASAARLLGR